MKSFFVCDGCGRYDEDQTLIIAHEKSCLERQEQILKKREDTGQLTIAKILEKGKSLPDLYVRIDSVGDKKNKYHDMSPIGTCSYRGRYDELAIEVVFGDAIKLKDFLKELEKSYKRTYSGWKGGEYTMWPDTFVWVDNAGASSQIAVVDLVLCEERLKILLVTKDLSSL